MIHKSHCDTTTYADAAQSQANYGMSGVCVRAGVCVRVCLCLIESIINGTRLNYVSSFTQKSGESWQWLFLRLPDDINQLIIDGSMAAGPGDRNGIFVDDISVQPCDYFSELVAVGSRHDTADLLQNTKTLKLDTN